jgi:Tfp pilus assembly protein FimT
MEVCAVMASWTKLVRGATPSIYCWPKSETLCKEAALIVKRCTTAGYSLLQVVVALAVSFILAGISTPVFMRALNAYRFSSAVSAVTGAITSTRFQAIMHGCPYQLVLTSLPMTYQVYSEVPSTVGSACATSYSAVGSAIPIPSAGPITMSGTSFTFTFSSNGTVSEVASPTGTGLQLANSLKSTYIYVSGVGNVSTCQPSSLCTCNATTPTICQ